MYRDVAIKWLNVVTLTVNIDKIHTLHYDVFIKWLNIVTITVNYHYIKTTRDEIGLVAVIVIE